MPSKRQLAVFDANQAKIVKYLPVAEEKVKITAGRDKLIVVLPGAKVIQRWSLKTFEREVTVPLAYQYQLGAIALGSDSDGPLLVTSVDWPSSHELFFFDIQRMKKLDLKPGGKGVHYSSSPDMRLSASPDGRVFTANGTQSYVLRSQGFDVYEMQDTGYHLLPGPDSRTLFSAGRMITVECKPLDERVGDPEQKVWYVPALHGPFYTSLNEVTNPRDESSPSLGVHLLADRRRLVTLPKIEAVQGLTDWQKRAVFSLERHVFLIPDARLLVVLPLTRDKLVLHRFDLDSLLAKTEGDYLFVQSHPVQTAVQGATYTYPLLIRSKRGGVKVTVDAGPPGMKVGADGKLTWAVPADFSEREIDVVLTLGDASGQEVFHTFKVTVGAKGVP